jgi:hypothetical protein
MKNLVAILENYIPARKMKEFVANFNVASVLENSKEERVRKGERNHVSLDTK